MQTRNIYITTGKATNKEISKAFDYIHEKGERNLSVVNIGSYLKGLKLEEMYEGYPEMIHELISNQGYGDINLITNSLACHHAIILANHINQKKKENEATHTIKKIAFISPQLTSELEFDSEYTMSLLKLNGLRKMRKILKHEQKVSELSDESLKQIVEDGYYVPVSVVLDDEKETDYSDFVQKLMSHGLKPETEYIGKAKIKTNTL